MLITVDPGKQFAEGELVTRAKLNQLANPTIGVEIEDGEVGEDQLDHAAIRAIVPYINRNLLINGNFDVWQRGGYLNADGLPTALGTTADPEYGADHWYLGEPSDVNKREIRLGMFTMGQTVVPNEPTNYLSWDQLVAETGANRPILSQPVEDVRTLAGKSATVTWWMKGDYSGNITCQLVQDFGTPAGPPSYPPRTVAATTGGTAVLVAGADWVQYTAKFDVPNLMGYGIDGPGHHLALQFLLPDNTTFDIDFAQIQMEEGTVATAYETLSLLEEIRRCERYFEFHAGIAADNITNNHPCYYFATRKYRAPDLTLLAGYSGTGMAFLPLLTVGYQQSTANSVVSAFFISAHAEII